MCMCATHWEIQVIFVQALFWCWTFWNETFPVLFHASFKAECYAKIPFPALGLRKLGFPFCLWLLNTNCLLASFTWVKATQKWLFPPLLDIDQPCSGPCIVKGLDQKRTRLIALIFSHCNLTGGKVSLLPWCIASQAYVTPTELCSLFTSWPLLWRGDIFK